MKFSLLFVLVIFKLNVYCQDQILTKDNVTYFCRIVQEEKKSVAYYLLDDTKKIIQFLDKKSIKKIKYEKPSSQINTVVIVHDSVNNKDLFSTVVSYLINSGYEIKTFDKDLLLASALFQSKFRISVEVDDHFARFSCYILEEEEDTNPTHSTSHVIRFSTPDNKDPKEEKYPGEEIDYAGGKAFKEMDKICRLYLMDNKGRLVYESE